MSEETADTSGIQRVWLDADGEEHRISSATVAHLRQAIGTAPSDLEDTAPIVTRPGRFLGLGSVSVSCEDGSVRDVGERLPADFPLGYHRLVTADGTSRRLVVSPGRCWLPSEPTWGWSVQLYAARSSTSWGIGDFADLKALRTWTEAEGGGFVLVNPLHAVAPGFPQEASPYLPATRRFRNPIYLHVPAVPGYSDADVDQPLAERLGALSTIDRDAVWKVKCAALRAAFERSTSVVQEPSDVFARWVVDQGPALREFATWSVLAETHGDDWHTWPPELREPHSPAVSVFAEDNAREVEFHAWLQWQLDVQLRDATADLTVIQDLPIGVSGGGADAWAWQDVLAVDMTVGAPPDKLNSLGQDWGSPPLVPWRLRAADYEPFIQSVRATINGAGGLRVDHVMGLFRLWWIPDGEGPASGGYVHYPSDDLLDIVALESHRAAAVVIGEDLGTVGPTVAAALRDRNILSYKVLWFEDDDPKAWPELALATVTTHDLPTVAGLWTGSDAEDQLLSTDMSKDDVSRGREELLGRLTRDGLESGSGPEAAVAAAYQQMSRVPSILLSLSLEDALTMERRPNIPGTTQRENWRIALPVLLDDVPETLGAKTLVALAKRSRRPGH